jgi:Protein of unknown function (DUF2490)
MFTNLGGGVALILFAALAPSFAQNVVDNNANAWLMYFGDHALNSRVGVHLEGQFRRADLGLRWQQLLLRPGVNFQINKYTSATVGYAYVNLYRYGDFPSRATLPEHRTFEQLWIKHPLGPLGLQHRFRVEQRNVQVLTGSNLGNRGWEFRQRFRYMFRTDIPLKRDKSVYLGLYDEFFINFGGNRGSRYLDQNRAYAAIGFKLSQFEKLELGYLYQYIPRRNSNIVEHNHALQIALFSSRPFRRGD